MKVRIFTKFGRINRAVGVIFCFNEKSEKRDIVKAVIKGVFSRSY